MHFECQEIFCIFLGGTLYNMGHERMTNERTGSFAANFGAIKSFLSSPEKFPGRIISYDGKETWIVKDEVELKEIRDTLEASCKNGATPLKVVANGA